MQAVVEAAAKPCHDFAVDTELRLLRQAYVQQGKAIGALSQQVAQLTEQLAQSELRRTQTEAVLTAQVTQLAAVVGEVLATLKALTPPT